jgi:hypothetical protein
MELLEQIYEKRYLKGDGNIGPRRAPYEIGALLKRVVISRIIRRRQASLETGQLHRVREKSSKSQRNFAKLTTVTFNLINNCDEQKQVNKSLASELQHLV